MPLEGVVTEAESVPLVDSFLCAERRRAARCCAGGAAIVAAVVASVGGDGAGSTGIGPLGVIATVKGTISGIALFPRIRCGTPRISARVISAQPNGKPTTM